MSLEQGDVFHGGFAAAEARAGLDEVGACVGNALAQGDLLVIGQHSSLNNDLQDVVAGSLFQGLDLFGNGVELAVLGPADVDDHIDFLGAVGDGVLHFEDLAGGGVVAVGEPDNGADGQLAVQIRSSLLHIGRGNADGCGIVIDGVVA